MKKISRRTILLGSVATVAGAVALVNVPPVRRSLCGDPSSDPEETLRTMHLTAIGKACVACDSGLTHAYVSEQWTALGAPTGEALDKRIRDDFAQGKMTNVQGWMFSQVEVLAYAATYHGIA
ncbi:hypothetical protein [Sphingobium lignivorans]|uniref:Uncharacterized protein n=1 Tax=Sphingobium lignivorans TaxID=2735886 RepID=A0ABR6NKD2_9SPHN|nr:hypothetical protein [Sphingobium lignivorans]MBB5986948.1 hypothetical protein [Sphingobium lignivorans]